MLKKKYKNTIISLIIIACWAGIIFVIAYPAHGAPGIMFGVIVYCILTLSIGIGMGIVAIISRFVRDFDHKNSFLYNFCGTLNLCLGILGAVLLISDDLTETNFILLFALSVILGFFILSDIYSSKKEDTYHR